jgi:hypothetical protein
MAFIVRIAALTWIFDVGARLFFTTLIVVPEFPAGKLTETPEPGKLTDDAPVEAVIAPDAEVRAIEVPVSGLLVR